MPGSRDSIRTLRQWGRQQVLQLHVGQEKVTYGMKGVEGMQIQGVEIGTMIFAIEEDDGMVHTSEIPGSH